MLRARYRRIVLFFGRVIANLVVWDIVLPRLGLRGWSARTRPERLRQAAVRYRALAIQMGGVLIKVGQFLSARLDVLPEVVTTELAGLQDEVPPESFEDIRRVAEAELGGPLDEKYASFDPAPLAAASLGQVHRARLRLADGQPAAAEFDQVVVKVQRPNVEQLIATDLAALRTVGNWIRRYPPIRRRADVPALLAEFTRSLYEEIDYLAEGRNAETFAANFKGDRGVCVPRVVWPVTTKRVLTLEDVYAVKITDYDLITALGLDRAEVAQRLFRTYLKQIFEDGFFHADPHPGNLFVEARDGRPGRGEEETTAGLATDSVSAAHPAWRLIFVDFGMVGRVTPGLRAGLRELVIGVGTRDAARVVKAYQLMGVLLPGADLALLERAEAKMFERFWGKNMTELRQTPMEEMEKLAREFRELLYTLPFQVPEDLILLGRTVAILSGMCTGLDPQFNVWQGLAPYAGQLIAAEGEKSWEFWLQEAAGWLRTVVTLPRQLEAMLGRIERGEVQSSDPRLTRQVHRLDGAVQRLAGSVVFAALLLGGLQLYLAGQALGAALLLVLSGLAGLWMVFLAGRGGEGR